MGFALKLTSIGLQAAICSKMAATAGKSLAVDAVE